MGRGGRRVESLLFSARYDGWWCRWCARRKKPGVGSGELGVGGVLVRGVVEGDRRDAGR